MADAKLQAYMDAAVLTIADGQAQVTAALGMIRTAPQTKGVDAQPVQLLALRRYLRIVGKNKSLSANWSWTDAEAKAAGNSEPTKTLYAEADKVRAVFATNNLGYRLAVSPVRSLERQVQLWNDNTTVHQAASCCTSRCSKSCRRWSIRSRPPAVR